jgi:hypothetical protein
VQALIEANASTTTTKWRTTVSITIHADGWSATRNVRGQAARQVPGLPTEAGVGEA